MSARIRPDQQRPGSRRTPLVTSDFRGADPRDARLDGVVGDVPIEKMTLPHQCRSCRRVYDGARVEVFARYADCSRWKAPCCGLVHDSRPAWVGQPGERMGYIDLRARAATRAERRQDGT